MIEVIIMLLAVGGHELVTQKNEHGNTALHYAYKYKAPTQVIMLLERLHKWQ